jgi:hypothetical protein
MKLIPGFCKSEESECESKHDEAVRAGRRRFLGSSAGIVGLTLLPEGLLHAAETPAKPAKPLADSINRTPTWIPVDQPNMPVGEAKGIFPGRVAWVRDPEATPWKGDLKSGGHWWDDKTGVNQAAVDRMISQSLRALTGAKNDHDAWDKTFRYHNRSRQRGNNGYGKGEMVAVKPNCNNCYAGYSDVDDQIDASPQAVLAMLRQLVHQAGVPQDKIVVYEAVRVIPDRVYNPCHAEFPGVIWVDSKGNGENGRQPVNWHKDAFSYSVTEKNQCGSSVPELVFQSTYLINMALMKGHPTCGFTLTAKNHYGTINDRDHKNYINTWQHEMGIYNPFVDLIGTNQLGGKTILFMIDALFGTRDANDPVIPEFASFTTLFGGQWSSSIFMSLDPVAIDSVGLDFLRSEFGQYLASSRGLGHDAHCDNYLHEAAAARKAPSGTTYKPDGESLGSLGVHEHWNNGKEKKYSRNLSSKGRGIELLAVHERGSRS